MDDVVPVHFEMRMGRVFHLEQQVAGRVWRAATLPLEPDHLAGPHTLGHADFQRPPAYADPHAAAGVGGFQRNGQTRPGIATRHRARTRRALPRSAPAAEQLFEKVAEAPARTAAGKDFLEVEAAVAESAMRRAHLVTGPVTALTQLVIGLALGRITQRLVGLVDRLEPILGPGLLADVRMVLARQSAVGGLDLRLTGAGAHAERVVIVLELHHSPDWSGWHRADRRPDHPGAGCIILPQHPPGSGAGCFPHAWGC